jgi:hypothetical protein
MRHLTIKDKSKMKYMGYSYRVYFARPNGVVFYKDFSRAEEMNDFILKAEQSGMTTEDIFEI